MNTKTNKTGQAPVGQQMTHRERTSQATVQAILAHNSQESDCDLDRETDLLDIDLLFTVQSDSA